MNLLTYDELRSLERRERDSSSLVDLGIDFIDRFNSYVLDKQRVLDKSDDNIIAAKVKERSVVELSNARNSFRSIVELRSRKIFNQAFIDLRMGSSPDFAFYADSEKVFYNEVKALLSNYLNDLSKGKLKKEDVSPEIKDNNILVRFVKEFPEFAWGDKVLGPFNQEDVANLPADVAQLLLSKEVIKVMLNEEC